MKKLNELSPKTKADYSKAAARSLAPSKKYADNYSDAAKASTGKDAKMYQDRSDKNKRDFINRVKGISRANESTDLRQYRKGGSKEGQLPPHLAKFIDPKTGNFTKDAEARIQKGKKSKNFKDVTPKGYGPKESVELDEGIVTKKLTGLVDKGLNKVLDQIEKKTGKHLGFVKKSTVPSAGKDRGNEFVKFKKEAEDFHRKAKKQWTWSSKEIEAGFQYYGSGYTKGNRDYRKIPDDKVKFVNNLQAEIQKIIDMHTKLESMMQTTGNSPTYQRTMEKLESDTKRVFKEIADSGIGASGGKYRAMQGMDNLAKAKKMTHKEPRQTSPAKFRSYANRGESVELDEIKEGDRPVWLSVWVDNRILPGGVHDSKEAGMKFMVYGDGPDGHHLVKTTRKVLGKKRAGQFVPRSVGKHLDKQPFPYDDGPQYSVHKESVNEGFLDTFLGRNMKKGNVDKKKSKKSKNSEQVKLSTEIDRKLRLIDDLMKKVRPLGGNLGRLMAFRKLPIDKMTPKGMYVALNDWWDSVEADLDDDSEDDNEKYAQSAEKLYDLWEEVGFKLSDYMWASGYNVKGIGQMAKIGFPAKKRTDPEWLKMNESVDEGFMDTMKQLLPGAKGKPAKGKPAKKLNAEQVKISKQIDKKLKLVDGLMQKVKPLGGQISGLMAFSKLPLEKMTPKDLYRVLNDWYKSVEGELDYGDDSVVLSKKYGRSVEDLHERMEELALKIKDYMYASGYDVPHGGAKFQYKWLNKVDFSAPKRTDAKWLKMNESVDVEMIIESVSPKQIAMLKKQYSSMPDRLPLDQAMKVSKMVAKFDKEALMKVAKADIKWISSAAKTNLISKHGATAKDFKESVSEDVPANNTGNVASHGNFPIGHEKLMRRPKLIDVTDKRYTKQTKEGKTVLKSFKSMMKK